MNAATAALPGSARALRLELKRNAVPYVLPLLAAVFFFNTVRTADAYPPVWTLRASVIGDHMLFEFSAFAGGLAAWAGSREGRRRTVDLVATTSRAAWARLSLALAGTLCWLLLAFLAGVAVLYVKTALQATAGGPPLWPVFVGAAGVIVVTVIGFTCGVLFPGRFTAPLVAVATLLLYQAGLRAQLGMSPASGIYAVLSPAGQPPMLDAGVYYRVPPDVSIVQVMLMGGIALALFGVLGLAAGIRHLIRADGLRVALLALAGRGDDVRLRMTAAVLIGCGIAASGTAIALAGTARPDAAGGWMIPALHSAASDRPIPVAWDCTSATAGAGARTAFQVCVSQAFSFYLHLAASALTPVAAEIAGLPGAPAGAREIASVAGGQAVMSGISGTPPVFDYTADHVGGVFGEFYGLGNGQTVQTWGQVFQQGMLDAFLAGSPPHAGGPADVLPQFLNAPTPLGAAQQAVENALLAPFGWQPAIAGQWHGPALAGILAAARRFGALPASARHAWLAAHLSALRAGTITLAQIP